MNILCRAGIHRPCRTVASNAGYEFTSCARCGCDLVRRRRGKWRRPRGFRVVWRSPAEAAAELIRQTHSFGTGLGSGVVPSAGPVQEVLQLLLNREFMDEQARYSSWDQQISVHKEVALSRMDRGDFMEGKPAPAPAGDQEDPEARSCA